MRGFPTPFTSLREVRSTRRHTLRMQGLKSSMADSVCAAVLPSLTVHCLLTRIAGLRSSSCSTSTYNSGSWRPYCRACWHWFYLSDGDTEWSAISSICLTGWVTFGFTSMLLLLTIGPFPSGQCVRSLYTMAGNNREDWLSLTIRMVETVMVRHGWVDEVKGPDPSLCTVENNKREWVRVLASALRMQKGIPQRSPFSW